jgi:hypothetical protein
MQFLFLKILHLFFYFFYLGLLYSFQELVKSLCTHTETAQTANLNKQFPSYSAYNQ